MTGLSSPVAAASATASRRPVDVAPPLWLLAELTYRCPLHCVFCYNPVDYMANPHELTTEQWISLLCEARALGAAQLGFSGGEPLLRDDLKVLIGEARRYLRGACSTKATQASACSVKTSSRGPNHTFNGTNPVDEQFVGVGAPRRHVDRPALCVGLSRGAPRMPRGERTERTDQADRVSAIRSIRHSADK